MFLKVWIAVLQLLVSTEYKMKYELTSYKKGILLRVGLCPHQTQIEKLNVITLSSSHFWLSVLQCLLYTALRYHCTDFKCYADHIDPFNWQTQVDLSCNFAVHPNTGCPELHHHTENIYLVIIYLPDGTTSLSIFCEMWAKIISLWMYLIQMVAGQLYNRRK